MTTRLVTTHIEDQPGQLGRLARALAKDNINIDAFEADHGNVCLLTSDPDRTVECLKQNGFKTKTQEAFAVRLPNKPGQLAEIGEALGKAKVNIISSFGAGETGTIYLNVDNVKAAQPIMERFGSQQVSIGAR